MKDLVTQYKSQVLPTLEFCTPAVYHCTASALEELDNVQKRFLGEVGLSAEQALLQYNLAPLQSRRDMAMLGLIHRTVLGLGPPQFADWFVLAAKRAPAYNTRRQQRLHAKQLHDWLETRDTELLGELFWARCECTTSCLKKRWSTTV